MRKSEVTIATLLVLLGVAFAGRPATEKETVSVKATIEAIDRANRLISFMNKDGDFETVHAGPEVKRFDELKVGDKVTFRKTRSVVIQVLRPGESAPISAAGDPTIARDATTRPSATVTRQETLTVTVKAVDIEVPSVTVETEDGHTRKYPVNDKGTLKGVNPGDRIVITTTRALLISVQ